MRIFFVLSVVLLLPIYLYAQCPTSGTISSNCTHSGNLTINGGSLTVNSGFMVTIIDGGDLVLQSGATLNASGATFVIDGGINERFGSLNTINGGSYSLSDDLSAGGGGSFTIDGAMITLSSNTVALNGSNVVINNTTITGASSLTMNLNSFSADNSDITASGGITIEDANITNSTLTSGGLFIVDNGTNTIDNTTINAGTGNTAPATGIKAFDVDETTLNVLNGSTINVTGDWENDVVNIDASDVIISGNFDNAGSEIVNVTNNGTLTINGNFDNTGSGNVDADGGGVIQVDGDFDNTNGDVDTDGGVVIIGGTFTGDAPTGDGSDCSTGGGACCGSSSICDAVLPVSLVYFNAQSKRDGVHVTWQTATEVNNDYFTIDRSRDGQAYEQISRIEGNGTTNSIMDYDYVDYSVTSGNYYYRLTQVDFDGKSETFVPVHVIVWSGESDLNVYPNPTSANILLEVNTNSAVQSIVASNAMGYMKELPFSLLEDKKYTVSTSVLEKGIYLLTIELEGIIEYKKVVKL